MQEKIPFNPNGMNSIPPLDGQHFSEPSPSLRLEPRRTNLSMHRYANSQFIKFMIPRNQQNRKLQINLACPVCAMSLTEPRSQGFVLNNETFCCQGCADGTGCFCSDPKVELQKAGNRRGALGQRNPENSTRDRNENEEVDTSGRQTGINKQETRSSPARRQSHGKVDVNGVKLPRGVAKERSSTREESRGRSEFRGQMNSRINDRVSRTGTKSK